MMIYRNTKGISFIEIIVSVAIISIIILGGAQAIKYIMHTMVQDRQQIQADNFAQMIIEELKAKCVPETFLTLKDSDETDDWEKNSPRKFPNLRGKAEIEDQQTDGTRKAVITISFNNWRDENNNPKKSAYHITLVKNTGLQPQGIISGRVVNYVTNRGIPGAEVSAPHKKDDGGQATCTTGEDGSFRLIGVKVGTDIPVTINKLGSRPNDMNYSPGYYFDPELIDPVTKKVIASNPKPYENWNSIKDSLSWSINITVQNNVVTDITDIIGGPVYLCPMAIVRGWVREDENVEASGIGKILVFFGNSGNFNPTVLDKNFRNSMHPYYTMNEIHGDASPESSTANAMAYLGDSQIDIRSYAVYNGNYYATTRDADETYTYAVEGKNITFDMKKGDFVFFNVRPGNNTESYYRYLKILGRPGSSPTVKRTDANFEQGYLRSYFSISGKEPRLIVRANDCFDTTETGNEYGEGPSIHPHINEAIGHHDPLPVTATATTGDSWSGYKYYYYGDCPHTHHNFNPVALASLGAYVTIPSHCGVDFKQIGWNNYETLLVYNPDKLSTCYVARRRGGIKGRIIDAMKDIITPIPGITVRSKSWADTSKYVSYIWTSSFRDNCPQVKTDSDGEFELNNIFGMEQQYFVTGKPTALIPNWNPHVDDFSAACNNDISIQDYAVLRITDDNATQNYMPRLIRPYRFSRFDHTQAANNPYPAPTWANAGGITDFGDIAMVNKDMGVKVIGRVVDTAGAPIEDATISTLGIFGINMGDENNLLNMSGASLAYISDTSDNLGNFTLNFVQPNFALLNAGTPPLDHVDPDPLNVQPRESIRRFLIEPPSTVGLTVHNVHIEGYVTDISGLNNVGSGADVWVGVQIPNTNLLKTNSLCLLTQTDSSDGHYVRTGTINNLPGEFWYYEHLPADNADDYTQVFPGGWDNADFTANRTINLGDIVIGAPVAQPYVFASSKTVLAPALGGYEMGDTAQFPQNQTNQNNGVYTIVSGANIVNANITLIRKYRVKLFGRVVDDQGNGLEGSRIRLQIYDGLSWDVYNSKFYDDSNYYTDSEGYWGDWAPAGFPGRGTEEFNLPLPAGTRTGAHPGEPYWRIYLRAYPSINYKSSVCCAPYALYEYFVSPNGWKNGIEGPWEDGMGVQVPTFILPSYYSEGM